MDLDYIRNITFTGDIRILLDTVRAVLKHEGISSETSATMEDFTEYCQSLGRKPREG